MRTECDEWGELILDDAVYYGIRTARALQLIPSTPVHSALLDAVITIKKAAAMTNRDIGALPPGIAHAIIGACDEVLSGRLLDQFMTGGLRGGADSLLNQNVNEVLANRAIELLGGEKGDYARISPLMHVNLHQSANDVFPTAVRIAAITLLKPVAELFADLQCALQENETAFASVLKVGRAGLRDALPVTLGQEFGAWAAAVSRDRWRLYKAEERLRQVGIGGTAVGTGVGAPRAYIFSMIECLRGLTGIGLARADALMDPLQNCDVFAEVSGLLKAAAVSLSKIAGDLRLLSSGPRAGFSEITLPEEGGTSSAPGEALSAACDSINQAAFQIMANDLAVTLAAQGGQLEKNVFLPLISKNLFEMLDLLRAMLPPFTNHCIRGIRADRTACLHAVESSPALAFALTDSLGQERAEEIAALARKTGRPVRDILTEAGAVDEKQFDTLLSPERLTSPQTRKKGDSASYGKHE